MNLATTCFRDTIISGYSGKIDKVVLLVFQTACVRFHAECGAGSMRAGCATVFSLFPKQFFFFHLRKEECKLNTQEQSSPFPLAVTSDHICLCTAI